MVSTVGETMIFGALRERGFQIAFHAHAEAILSFEFRESMGALENALLGFGIPIAEIISGGGGEAKGTQRLRHALKRLGWEKTTFTIEKRINAVMRESQSHEVDHVLTLPSGAALALEIEWNNKDPFFDRDLENFKRLHADGAISVGFIVTRSAALHEGLVSVVRPPVMTMRSTVSTTLRAGASPRRHGSASTSWGAYSARRTLFRFAMRSQIISSATSLAKRRRTGASSMIASDVV